MNCYFFSTSRVLGTVGVGDSTPVLLVSMVVVVSAALVYLWLEDAPRSLAEAARHLLHLTAASCLLL